MIGWVAKLGASRASLASFSTNKYGPQQATDPWWSAAGNGVYTNGSYITTNDPTDANMRVDTNFQAGWVEHLTNLWGTAVNGGLSYYIMDNEWSIWHSTHRDVHPVGATMAEVLSNFCNYALMVKGIDSNAIVAGRRNGAGRDIFTAALTSNGRVPTATGTHRIIPTEAPTAGRTFRRGF